MSRSGLCLRADIARPIPFHNLDSATDVHRVTDFIVANLQTSAQEPKDLTKELARIIEHPPDRKLRFISGS